MEAGTDPVEESPTRWETILDGGQLGGISIEPVEGATDPMRSAMREGLRWLNKATDWQIFFPSLTFLIF